MKPRCTTIGIGLFLSLTLTFSLIAQEDTTPTTQKYKSRYSHDLFEQADTNGDGFVDWNEARSSSSAIEKDRLGRKRFNQADVDNDGKLSVLEAKKFKHFEVKHRGEGKAKGQQLKNAGSDTGERTTKKEAIDVKRPHNKERVLNKKSDTRKQRNRSRDKSGAENDR